MQLSSRLNVTEMGHINDSYMNGVSGNALSIKGI